jgi:hypothetical protein
MPLFHVMKREKLNYAFVKNHKKQFNNTNLIKLMTLLEFKNLINTFFCLNEKVYNF